MEEMNSLCDISFNEFDFKIKKYRKAEYVQRRVCFVNVQSSLHDNVVFSVCALMCNAELKTPSWKMN